MVKPKLVRHVFEGRYDHGYRYLDRCGDTLLVLEDVLPSETGKIWMPHDVAPTGAKLKCPELDLTVSFDSHRLVVDQEPDVEGTDLAKIAAMVFAVICARFDLKHFVRFGNRRFNLWPTDSVDEAQKRSVRVARVGTFSPIGDDKMKLSSVELTTTHETIDRSEGYRLSISAISKVDAPQNPDPRLLQPPHLLEKGQREALIDQLRRNSRREKDPIAGVLIDFDYYWIRPSKPDLKAFFERAAAASNRLVDSITRGS